MIPLKDDNPTSTVPVVTVGIIVINIAVFVYMSLLGPAQLGKFVLRYSVIPARLFDESSSPLPSEFLRVLLSMFMHGGILHVAGNMLFLWVFGDNIEDALGHARYLFFYLACGAAAAFAHAITNPESTLPMLGASGAVSGVLGAYMVLFPKARVLTFFFFLFFWQLLKVPAVFIIGLWIVLQVLNGLTTYGQSSGGVAWFSHVGGFLAGVLLILVMKKSYYHRGPYRRLT